ncbi:MAG: 50S ribosomal protein L3 N(5)-glutamine methyltransferase [Gammaproteobacteria bacterium]|nr:50S ribosomal protein L3 N(5)-glutamine methyltransferase [Gammaproteobacteria bacterium]
MSPLNVSKTEIIDHLCTLGDFLRFAVSQASTADLYCGHGTLQIWDDMAALILGSLSLPIDSPSWIWGSRLLPHEKHHLLAQITCRIEQKVPVPYLTNEAWFAGLPFYVDERVLIPRSPFAQIIETQFAPWIAADAIHSVLEIGTGSACMAIATAFALPQAEIYALDISPDALAVAKVNVDKHRLSHQVHLLQSDVFSAIADTQRFDLIISNPPYVDGEDMQSLPAEYQHEPTLALAAGTDGLEVVRRILKGAAAHLNPQGVLMVEVGNSSGALVEAYPTLPFIWVELNEGDDGIFVLTREALLAYQGL